MLRINRRKMIGLLLLSVSAIVYVFALASGQDSIFEYTLLLACLTFALLLNNDFELISPAVLFTAYFLYSIALGPIGLMNMGRFYSYGYTKIILGGLLAFAIGNGICLIAKKRPVHEKEDKPKIRFSFSRIKTLYFLLAVSWSAALYYFIKNRSYLLGDVENGRVAAISGSGALLYTAQVSILLVNHKISYVCIVLPYLVCLSNYKINFNNSYKNDDNIFIIIVLRKVIIIDKIGLSFTKSIIL